MTIESILTQALISLTSAAVGMVVALLIASARKISPAQLEDFEERVVEPICERLEKVEAKLETFCTRGELREAVERMERASETNRRENRENFQHIFRRLEARERG